MSEKQEPRTIDMDDLFWFSFLQGAQLSPDGKTIVYAISHVEKGEAQVDKGDGGEVEEKEYITLWLLSLKAGDARQLTAGLARDWSPQWSPTANLVLLFGREAGGHTLNRYGLFLTEPEPFRPVRIDSEGRAQGDPQAYGIAAWSPTGDRIAYQACARPRATGRGQANGRRCSDCVW